MICTCEKCKRDFFPECEGDVFCPECGGEVVILQGGQELHYLIDLLAKGDVREALAVYINTEPEKKPELMDVVDRINTLLDSIPHDISEKYYMELNYLKGLLLDYYNERYYEKLKRRGIPKIATIGKKLFMGLLSLEQKIRFDKPGAGEKLMPWAYPESKKQKQIKEWQPGAEAVFRHFMPTISVAYPTVYFSEAYKYKKLRGSIVEEVGCTLKAIPEDSSLEYIHGTKGGAILIRMDQLPDKVPEGSFLHLFWHELGHFYAINADPYNLERFDDPDNPPKEKNVKHKQKGYWFWQEFIAEAIANHVSYKFRSAEPTYHPENIDWKVENWSGIVDILERLLDETFFTPDIDEYCLAHYFATLLVDDLTLLYVKAAEEGKLRKYGDEPAGSIDATCIDELDAEKQPVMREMKKMLETQMQKEKFWEIDEAGIEWLGRKLYELM